METSSKRKMSTSEDNDIAVKEQNVKRVHVKNGSQPEKCCCNLVLQQQREIEQLKSQLESKEEIGKNWTDLSRIEQKLNRLAELIEKKPDAKPSTAPNFSLDSLHNKVDKLVRVIHY